MFWRGRFRNLGNLIGARSGASRAFATLVILIISASTLTACSNRLGSNKTGSTSLPQLLGNSANYPIYVTQVVKSSTSPSTLFDILGDGTGSIGAKCGTTSQSATSSSATNTACVCTFTYVTSGGSKQTLETQALYTESDLLRCSYVGVPTSLASVQVQIRIVAGGYSNPTDYAFANTNGPGDSANIANFSRVRRYQCKKLLGPSHEGVSYAWDSSFYDPVQAEDPHNADVLNFYTTNMGATLTYLSVGSGNLPAPLGWYCPPNSIDDSSGTAIDAVNQLDFRLYSVNTYGGSNQIYPPVPGNDRYTFYLATQPTGVFSVPVNAYVGPRLMSSEDSSGNGTGIPPIGYAAAPVLTTVSGTQVDSCPDVSSVPIPAGYQWVKVWLFRTTTPQKTIRVSQNFGQKITGIGCNPGNWFNPPAPLPGNELWRANIIPGCYKNPGDPDGIAYSIQDLGGLPAGSLVSRFIVDGTNPGACFKSNPVGGLDPGVQIGAGNSIPGADTLKANRIPAGQNPPPYSCGGTTGGDPTGACGDLGGNWSVLYDSNLTTRAIPVGDVNGSNYDFVFVVSPPSVTLPMMNQLTTVSQFTPFRFATPAECGPMADPNTCIQTLQGAGNQSYVITNYGLKLHAVNELDNPNGDDPTRVGAFPICAIQPKP